MRDLNPLLDKDPHLVDEFVSLDIRNHQAQIELEHYSSDRRFLGIHPITQRRNASIKAVSHAKELKSKDKDSYVREIANTQQNIRRIKSNLRLKKYRSEQERESWQHNLERAEDKLRILSQL